MSHRRAIPTLGATRMNNRRTKIALIGMVLILGVSMIPASSAWGDPMDYVAVTDDEFQTKFHYSVSGKDSYWEMTIRGSGLDDGDVPAGRYDGWCVDKHHTLHQNNWYSGVEMFNSYADDLPTRLADDDWDIVNWIINNNDDYTWQETQDAIWWFIGGGALPAAGTDARALVDDAEDNGEGFVPHAGESLALILDVNANRQITIIEWTVGSLDISGHTFLDANEDADLDSGEPLVAGTTVELYDGDGEFITSTTTDGAGFYEFTSLPPGDYEVVVPASTSADDSNDALDADYDSTTGTSLTVTLTDSDSDDNDFGWWVDLTEVTVEDDDGEGRTIGWWKQQLKMALGNGKGKQKAKVDADTLETYVDSTAGIDDLDDAYDMITSTSSDACDLLGKQYVAFAFNEHHGYGLDDGQSMTLLVQTAAAMWADCDSYSDDELLDMKDIMDDINNLGH